MSTQIGHNPFKPSATSVVFNPDLLIGGNLQPVTRDVIVTGGIYKRGTILGKIIASGKYTLCVKGGSDGSELPSAILVDDCDATADVNGSVFLMGEFNANAVIFDPSWTVDALIVEMDKHKVFLRDPVKSPVIE